MLGRLERVALREVWRYEDVDFTPWLAEAENLEILSETLGINLELEAQERSVGPFRADILCRDRDDDSWVLIENQLEPTDHKHLGQLLTYASGLQAVSIIWIAERFTEEHRSALDWLNEITDISFRFFGLEVELWRIGDSLAAPKFNIVSKPNDWSKEVAAARRGQETSSDSDYHSFWEALLSTAKARSLPLPLPARSRGRHDIVVRFPGKDKFAALRLGISKRDKSIGCWIVLRTLHANLLFDHFLAHRAEIDGQLSNKPEWIREYGGLGTAQIAYRQQDQDITDQARWSAQHDWLLTRAEALYRVFEPRITAIEDSLFEVPDSE